MNTELKPQSPQLETVWFHEHPILIANLDKTYFVAMKPICESMGLDWRGQRQRIIRDPILSTSVVVITTQLPGDTQQREVTFLSFEFFHGWLFTIDATRVKPELKETILTYQRECYRVLAKHFSNRDDEPIKDLQDSLNKARIEIGKKEAYWFRKYPHWRMIRQEYYLGYPFSYIARIVDKSASACRRAVKRMEVTGMINPRYAAFHRLPDGPYRLWLLDNSQAGW